MEKMTAPCEFKAAARIAGHPSYSTGKPCSQGHMSNRRTKDGGCIECARIHTKRFLQSPKGIAYRRRWRAQPHVRERDNLASIKYGKLSRYGLTWEEHQSRLAAIGNKCQVCDKPFEERSRRNGACVDHCHDTGKVRGFLCHSCNRAIGLLKDDPDLLRKAAAYLSG